MNDETPLAGKTAVVTGAGGGLGRFVRSSQEEGIRLGEFRGNHTLIRLLTNAASEARIRTGITTVVLAGGAFQNEILLN